MMNTFFFASIHRLAMIESCHFQKMTAVIDNSFDEAIRSHIHFRIASKMKCLFNACVCAYVHVSIVCRLRSKINGTKALFRYFRPV